MSVTIFILGIVLGGILTLVTLIFTIISLASGKTKNAAIWGVGFLIALTILITSVFNVMRRMGEKLKTGVEWLEQNKNKGLTYNGDNLAEQEQERQYFLDTLKKYTNEGLVDKVPADYYANKPADPAVGSKVVLPFVFPLSIKYNTDTYMGDIISDVNDSVYLNNVSQMAFDQNFAIAKVNNAGSPELLKEGRGEIEYVLFDLRTREYLVFTSEQQLIEKAGKIGYSGRNFMDLLSDLYRGWLDPLNFDF
ncbi:hypothetical protein BH10BAC1_BH10BAC1_16590 [soil metagenome]